MSAKRKPRPEETQGPEETPKEPKRQTIPGGSESDIARANELIDKYGLQRLRHDKR